jgi:glutamine synthetase
VTGVSDIFVATCDLAGQVRGRGAPATAERAILSSGTGWVPANLALTAFGDIAPDDVFGSTGELRLPPDPAARLDIPADGERPGLRRYLADQTLPDGTAWPCCPRGSLRRALADPREATGPRVIGITGGAGYPDPVVWPGQAGTAELTAVPALPGSLDEALRALTADTVARSWLDERLLASHLAVKRHELAHLAGLTVAERIGKVAGVY